MLIGQIEEIGLSLFIVYAFSTPHVTFSTFQCFNCNLPKARHSLFCDESAVKSQSINQMINFCPSLLALWEMEFDAGRTCQLVQLLFAQAGSSGSSWAATGACSTFILSLKAFRSAKLYFVTAWLLAGVGGDSWIYAGWKIHRGLIR